MNTPPLAKFDLTHFNPGQQDEASFIANFIARQAELGRFMNELRHTPSTQAVHHHLIVAPRGYGKTSLLRRICIAARQDEQLKKQFIALTFREEQHNVISLDIFWRNCLDELRNAREDEGADAAEINALEQLYNTHPPRSNLKKLAQNGELAYAAFAAACAKIGRRPLLLMDNLDSLLEGLKDQHWALRTTLQLPTGPMLIAASSRYPSSLKNHEDAFYDFFYITNLAKLSDAEVMHCLRQLAQKRGEKGKPVLQLLGDGSGRIAALNTMAGGNPRTLGVLYAVLESHMSRDILQQLAAMLDTFTGWYQARTEELPQQARAVFDALALNWDPITAATISERTGLDTPTVSSQLSRLEKESFVETVSLSSHKKGRNAYQVSERFYNIWYLMRNGPRRTKQTIDWLAKFLAGCFSGGERQRMARDALLQNGKNRPEYMLALATSLSRHRVGFELAKRALDDMSGSRDELCEVAEQLLVQSGRRITSFLFNCLEKAKNQIEVGEYLEAEATYKNAIKRYSNNTYIWLFLGILLASDLSRSDEAEAAFKRAIEINPKFPHLWVALGNLLVHLNRFEEAEAAYRRAIETEIETDLDFSNSRVNLGNLLANHLGRFEEAEVVYRQAIEIEPKSAKPWIGLGCLLQDHLDRFEEAEAAYIRATEIDPKSIVAWGLLGALSEEHLNRFREAEAAYKRAIEIDPTDAAPWNNLGNLFAARLNRFEDAEAAYKRAIEIDPKCAYAWNNFGNLLADHLHRYEEAEAAYKRAIEIDPKYAYAWYNLGNFLADHLNRYEDAEAAYKHAIEINPKDADPWINLGNLLADRLNRYEEAEAAYKRAIEIDPKDANPWNGLGVLLAAHLHRYEDAEAAYKRAIELDPTEASSWNVLGYLLVTHLHRYEDAEAAYKRVIKIDPKNAGLWNRFGNVLADYLHRFQDAEAAYKQAIALATEGDYAPANLAYLYALHLHQSVQAAQLAAAAFSQLASCGALLLQAALAWSDQQPGANFRGWQLFNQALAKDDALLWTDYIGDIQRNLAYAVCRGDGMVVRAWMEEAQYNLKYAPLYHAFCALIYGEDHLLSINPETRGAAQQLYVPMARMLVGMRESYKNYPKLG